MTIKQCKSLLADCHLEAGSTFNLYKDCGTEYLIDRVREEFVQLKVKEASSHQKLASSKLIIQLLTMYRAKVTDEIPPDSP